LICDAKIGIFILCKILEQDGKQLLSLRKCGLIACASVIKPSSYFHGSTARTRLAGRWVVNGYMCNEKRRYPRFLLAAICLVGFAVFCAQAATFTPTDDTFIDWTQKNTPLGSQVQLIVRPVASWELTTLIKFNLGSIPAGATVTSAKLRLYYFHYNDADPAGSALNIHRITQNWNEGTATWNNRPEYNPVSISSATVSASYGWIEWDLTDEVQGIVDGAISNFGWQVMSNSALNPMIYFRSKEYSDSGYRPYLEVEFERIYVVRPDGSGDYPTIQAAINAASNTDIIELTDGTFTGSGNRDIDYLSKAVTVRSQSRNPLSCIIDCQNLGRGFIFKSDEDSSSVLEAVTIINGVGSPGGGGILCGGTSGFPPTPHAGSPTVNNCIITSNSASGGGLPATRYGGGIYCCEGSSPNLNNCTISNNTCSGTLGQGIGGGMYCSGGRPILTNCVFSSNFAPGSGGGFGCQGTWVSFTDCIFSGNTAGGGLAGIGGGLASAESHLTFNRCTFSNNAAGLNGGAMACWDFGPTLTNCTLYANSATNGGGIYLQNLSTSAVLQNTIIANSAAGQAIYCYAANAALSCCDVYGNAGGDWVGCIVGQNNNNGNFHRDGLFCDPNNGDLTLHYLSPCGTFWPARRRCGIVGAWPVKCWHLGDYDHTGNVDFNDLAIFSDYWLQTGCGSCGGVELTGDGNINLDDLSKFASNWLAGNEPPGIDIPGYVPCLPGRGGDLSTPAPSTLTVTINTNEKRQTIHNFGASDAWSIQFVGQWPSAKRNAIADLLFETGLDGKRNPRGIGLSAWRFNIGAGSSRQNNIPDTWRRADTFLSADYSSYDWSRLPGQRWFLQAAKGRGLEQFIAFVNSPPINMTKNGKAYCDTSSGTTNLASDKADDFALYIAAILKHFKNVEGIEFGYISPFNEPNWDWNGSSQEGCRYNNADIKWVVNAMYTELQNQAVSTEIEIPEAGEISYLYNQSGTNGDYIDSFFNTGSSNYIGNKLARKVAGHSYFTCWPEDDRLVGWRENLRSKLNEYTALEYWMTEYCIYIPDGSWVPQQHRNYGNGRDLGINPALWVARLIHYDLTVAEASAWQWWLAVSPYDYKDGLVYIDKNQTDGNYYESKMLWAMGNFSRFIRPGMRRVAVLRSDNATADDTVQGLMISAYYKEEEGIVAIVFVNWAATDKPVQVRFLGTEIDYLIPYITMGNSAVNDNLTPYGLISPDRTIRIPARAVVTIVGY
jgi:O-glycosyl hydrolase